jgi:hypothetical protein
VSSHDPRSRAYCLARLFKSRIFSICVRSEGGPCRSVTQPVCCSLVGGSVVCYASVVDDPDHAFFLSHLSSTRRVLIVSRGTCWSLIVVFLSAIPCKVTGFSAKETCEDFPLSILLDRSSRVPSFSAPSYTLFISISSWEEVFRFRDSCSSSSW